MGPELAGGLLGTLLLTSILRAGSELGFTRMDLALIIGTTVTKDRRRARAIGHAMNLVFGFLFALAYGGVFRLLGRASWELGAIFGALHAIFVGTVVINVLLPAVHPLMGTPETSANEYALIEPPGFLMLNYGRNTFFFTLVAHAAFGAVVGWAAGLR
jgi:hypothetical protein